MSNTSNSIKPISLSSGKAYELLDKPVLNPRYGGMTLREMTERLLTPKKKNRKSRKPPPPDGKVQFPL